MLIFMILCSLNAISDALAPRLVHRSTIVGQIHGIRVMPGSSRISRVKTATYEDVDAIMMSQSASFGKIFVGIGRDIRGVTNRVMRRGAATGSGEAESLKSQLAAAGTGGLVAYGCMNCLYYTIATAFFWFALPKEAASSSAVILSFADKVRMYASRLPKTMAIVWAGSQVTKVPRIAGSLVLTPLARKVIGKIEDAFGISHKTAVAWCSASLLSFTALFYAALVVSSAMLM